MDSVISGGRLCSRYSVLLVGFAGLVSSVVFHPVDSYKAHAQFQLKAGSTVKRYPLHYYFRGVSVVAALSIPSVALYFATLQAMKDYFPDWQGPSKEFVSGIMAQLTSSFIATPRDVIKQRLQVQHLQEGGMKERYHGSWAAAKDIFRSEGLARGLYRGWAPELALWALYGSLYLMAFREAKEEIRRVTGETGFLPVKYVALSAGVASAFTAFVTNPADLLKLHYQTKPDQTFAGLAREVQSHGTATWMKGSLARVLAVAPRTTMAFTLFEFGNSLQRRMREKEAEN